MSHDTAPAIRGRYDERYSDIERLGEVGAKTNFHRGFGTTGTKVLLVNAQPIGGCPRCGEQEMVLSLDLHPDDYDDAEFYCTNVACAHFVGDEVEFDMDRIRADTPHEWDNTAWCPDCESNHTVRLRRGVAQSRNWKTGDAESGGIVAMLCDECIDNTVSEIEVGDDE